MDRGRNRDQEDEEKGLHCDILELLTILQKTVRIGGGGKSEGV